jgi:hypothetical protein
MIFVPLLSPFLPCIPRQVEGTPAGVSTPAPRREPKQEKSDA